MAQNDLIVSVLSSPCSSYCVEGVVCSVPVTFVIDTGAAVSLINNCVWNQIARAGHVAELQQWIGNRLVGVNGSPLSTKGFGSFDIVFGNKKFGATLIVTGDITVGAILGLDFLENHKCCIDCGAKILTFPQNKLSVQVHHVMPVKVEAPIECPAIGLVTLEKIVVPPSSEMEVMVKQASPGIGTWMVETDTSCRTGVMVARSLVCTNSSSLVPIRLLNSANNSVVLKKGMKVASMSQLHEDCTTQNISAVTEHIPLSQGDQEALWSMVCKVGDHLNDGEKELLFHLLMEYADVFAFKSGQIGRTNILKHRIDTGNTPPVHLLPRRIPQSRREEMAKLVKDMLEQGAIQQSDSPWSSPVVLVKKKDGSVRFCVDYRKVNSVTRKDAYPLPRVDDTLDTLAGSRLFTTLDLASGYWQVEVAEEDQPKTAFTTPEGLFQFRVMPFGLCNAPATFQRLMDRVLGGLKWSSCLVYLDDIIIVGTSFSEHLRNLAGVLQRLRQAGLKLKPSKCKWCQKSVTFLGHIVSEEGVAADPSKTAVVAGWPPPQSKREMQQFLGLANYYRKFVKNFAAIAKPLHRLTEKNTDFKWTVECQHAFDVLRACLSSPPVLSYPDYSRRFVLDTDASDIGIGAVLSQEDATGSEVVIAYASRTLSRPEQRYCVTRKELLAAVEFIHHFRQYLLGREFTLRTDHSSLVWLRNFKEPEGQLARWLEKLQEYSFSVVHRQGIKHGNADALSRVPCRQCGRESHETTPIGDVIEGSVTSLPCTSYTPQWIRQQQLDDCSIRPVYQALESKLMLSADEVKPWSRESRLLWQQHTSLYLKDGVLWRRVLGGGEGKLQLVVPAKLRQDILRSLHEGALSAHLGEEKMRNLLKERFYWPSCADDVSEWCSCCAVCCSRKTHAPKRRAGLQTLQVGYPLQMVCVDLLGPLPETETGSRYVLVAVDHFTKWAEAYGIPNQEAATVARKLVDEMFCRFSPPEQLHSDQGRQFESELVKEVCKLLEIKKTHTTPYHPQCNGIVERFNRTLLGMLATTVDSYPSSWEQNIRRVCLAYNSSVHASTGFSPFFLMFGRQVKLPVDLMYGTTQGKETAVMEYVKNLKDGLLEAYALVRDRCETEHKRQKSIYDRKVHGEPYSEGDLVWLYTPAVPSGQSRKLHRPWKGPYKVVERLGDATYKLQGTRGRRPQIVHFDRLKPCPPNVRLANEPRPERPAADEVVLPTPKPGEQCELLEEDEDYAAPVAPPNELPAAGPGDQTAPQRRYPDRNRRQPDRYGPFIKH